jgi:hypothetical protein
MMATAALPHTAACQCTAAGVCGRLIPENTTLCVPCQDGVCRGLHYGADPALTEARLNYLHAVALEVQRPGAVGAWLALREAALGRWPMELRDV